MAARLVFLVLQFVGYIVCLAQLANDYAYEKVDYVRPQLVPVAVCLVAILVIALLLPSALGRPSDGLLWIMASFVVVPLFAVSCANPAYDPASKITASLAAFVGFAVLAVGTRGNTKQMAVRRNVMTKGMYLGLLASAGVALTAIAVVGFGFSGFNLNLSDVYERRLSFREVEAPFPGANYLLAWLKRPVVPLLLAAGIQWRRWPLLAIGLIASAVVISLGGEKSIAFQFGLMLVVVFCFNRAINGDRRPWFGLSITLLLWLPLLIKVLDQTSSLSVLVTRRLGISPAQLTIEYVDYAQETGFTFFTHNVFKIFMPANQQNAIGELVGDRLQPGSGTNANANLWADGYVALGILGVVISSLALVVIVRFCNRLAASRDMVVAGSALVGTLFILTNGYLPSALTTGGLLVALLAIWAMPDPRNEHPNRDGPDPHQARSDRGTADAVPLSN